MTKIPFSNDRYIPDHGTPSDDELTCRILRNDRLWTGILKYAPADIIILRSDLRIDTASNHTCTQLGIEECDLVGMNYEDILDRSISEARLQKIEAAMVSETTSGWEELSGDRLLGFTAIPIREEAKLMIVGRDLSEQRKLRDSEKNKRARLRTLIETLPDLIWLTDEDGRFVNCNKKFERLLGVPETDIKGKTADEFLSPSVAESLNSGATVVLTHGCPIISHEWVSFADDDHQEYVELIQTPFVDETGIRKGVMGIGRDVTEFKRHEEELRRQHELLEEMFNDRTKELSVVMDKLKQAQN